MKMPRLIMTVTAAVMLAAPAHAQDTVHPPLKDEEPSARKVKELQKERLDALKTLVEVTTKLAVSGRAPIEEALEARLLLLQAEVDAAEKESDRITLYKRCVDALQEYEAIADAQKQAARGTEATALKIKSRRLEVEIRLEQARAKETRAGKPVR